MLGLLTGCSNELPPTPVPNTQEIIVDFEDKDSADRECLVGINPAEADASDNFRVYTLNIPSVGGTYVVSVSWKDYPDVINPVDKLTMTSIYSPMSQERINLKKEFSSSDLERSGIEEINVVSESECRLMFFCG
ncbi:MAG: hypothetical protein J6C81_04065 [Muribaculaceae bacterium]|nr:hypothetical protein [Muribaculaceae bacterium]